MRTIAAVFSLAGQAWSWVGYFMPDQGMFSFLMLGPPEYAFFIVIFSCTFVILTRAWIFSLTPHGKLYNLIPEIEDLYKSIGQKIKVAFQGEQLDKAANLSIKLGKLGISCPDIDKPIVWYYWLPLLSALAKNCKLKEAREMSQKYKEESSDIEEGNDS